MNFLKNKLILISAVMITAFLVSTYFTAVAMTSPKKELKKLPEGARYLNKDEINQMVESDEYKAAKEKTEKKLKDAWDDIVSTFNIDTSNYVELTLEDLSLPDLDKKFEKFADNGFRKVFDETYSEFKTQRKAGQTEPIIFIKDDGSEILFGSKDIDGHNVVVKAVKDGNKWSKLAQSKVGKKQMSMGN